MKGGGLFINSNIILHIFYKLHICQEDLALNPYALLITIMYPMSRWELIFKCLCYYIIYLSLVAFGYGSFCYNRVSQRLPGCLWLTKRQPKISQIFQGQIWVD